MFRPNDKCYVKSTFGYVSCKVVRKQGSYYIIQTESSIFGATEHRLISPEEYKRASSVKPKQTYCSPPDLH